MYILAVYSKIVYRKYTYVYVLRLCVHRVQYIPLFFRLSSICTWVTESNYNLINSYKWRMENIIHSFLTLSGPWEVSWSCYSVPNSLRVELYLLKIVGCIDCCHATQLEKHGFQVYLKDKSDIMHTYLLIQLMHTPFPI